MACVCALSRYLFIFFESIDIQLKQLSRALLAVGLCGAPLIGQGQTTAAPAASATPQRATLTAPVFARAARTALEASAPLALVFDAIPTGSAVVLKLGEADLSGPLRTVSPLEYVYPANEVPFATGDSELVVSLRLSSGEIVEIKRALVKITPPANSEPPPITWVPITPKLDITAPVSRTHTTATGAILNAPIALNDVRLAFETSQGPQPLVFVARGAALLPVTAIFFYTGSGVLRDRWELVLPGDVAPTERDLLPEAGLPRSERGTQRRYQLLQRFEQLLPGNGRVELKLPTLSPTLGTTAFDGQYQLLLRIEAEPDIYGGASGAANFAVPLLRYFVGSITAPAARIAPITAQVTFNGARPTFRWSPVPEARYYRVEVIESNNTVHYSAIVRDSERSYSALSGFTAPSGSRWRVKALDEALQAVGESSWRELATQ